MSAGTDIELLAGLYLPQPCIVAIAGEELIVGSGFGERSMIKDKDAIGMSDR